MGLLILLRCQVEASKDKVTQYRKRYRLPRKEACSNYAKFSFLFALFTQLLVTMSQSYLTLGKGKASLGHSQKLPCVREVGTSTNHAFLRRQLLQIYLPGTYEGIVY